MTLIQKVALVFGLILVGFSVGKYSQPAKVVETEKIVYQDHIVYQKDLTDKSHIKKTEIISPDGTISRTEEIQKDTDLSTHLTKETDIVSEKTKTTTNSKPQLLLSLGVSSSLSRLTEYKYEVMISKRFLGPVFLGVKYNTDNQVGAFATMEF